MPSTGWDTCTQPTLYQAFILEELRRLRQANPAISHGDAFKQAVENWSEASANQQQSSDKQGSASEIELSEENAPLSVVFRFTEFVPVVETDRATGKAVERMEKRILVQRDDPRSSIRASGSSGCSRSSPSK